MRVRGSDPQNSDSGGRETCQLYGFLLFCCRNWKNNTKINRKKGGVEAPPRPSSISAHGPDGVLQSCHPDGYSTASSISCRLKQALKHFILVRIFAPWCQYESNYLLKRFSHRKKVWSLFWEKETRELTYTKQQDVTILILFSMRLSLRWAEKHALLSWILSQVKFTSQNFQEDAY